MRKDAVGPPAKQGAVWHHRDVQKVTAAEKTKARHKRIGSGVWSFMDKKIWIKKKKINEKI